MALDRDAYFTPLDDCNEIIKTALNDHHELKHLKWVEPSAGSGNFVKAAKLNGINNIEAYDIHPLGDNIVQRDFLNEDTDLTGSFVFGNPPYGIKQKLSLDFIDRAFEQGAEYVGFLLMGSFTVYSNLEKIKARCEIISIRRYRVNFIDEHGHKAKACLANDKGVIFIILKKSNKRIKDLAFKEKWDKLREESNSEYLLKKCIQNYSYKTHINLLRNKLNYPHEVLNMLIKNQLSKKYGKCFDYFKELEEVEQRYFLECYTIEQDKTKQQSAKDLNITNSRMMTIELKMKQIARVEQYNMDFNIYINGGDIHGK